MITFPSAKINLGLYITERRTDGYHNLETCFYPIPWFDALEIVAQDAENGNPAKSDSFTITGMQFEGNTNDNLVMKALFALRKHYPTIPTSRIWLQKVIPTGAGLGGGSADAAFMLKLVNTYYQLGATEGFLEEVAASLGADCPFFIRNKPMYAEGIGTTLSPIELSLTGWYFTIIKPEVSVSTALAYKSVQPRKPETYLKGILQRSVEEWQGQLINQFEETVFPAYPSIAALKEAFLAAGATYASMSGSGSSVFALSKAPLQLPAYKALPQWEGYLP
jgi:4-diphosphocytidyl-2-C-methyl-D-erythritol kinase